MKEVTMKEKRQTKKQITSPAIPTFITSAICYAAMWAIMARTESAFFAGYIGGVGTVDQVKHILICILVGVILFVLPLEKMCDKTYCVIRYCGSLLTDKNKYRDGTAVFLLVFLYALVCWAGTVFSLCTDSGFDDGGHWGLFRSGSDRIYALVITILAFVVMIKSVDLIKNNWAGMLIWFLIELANVTSVKLVTGKDDLTFAIICAETVMFIIYMAVQYRLNIAMCLASLLCGAIMMFAGCEEIFTSKHKMSGASLVSDMSQSGRVPDKFFEARYNITIIEKQAGIPVCILWFVLFAILSFAVIGAAAKLIKVSARRGTFVLGIYMISAFMLIYTVLAELGIIKPAETLLLLTDVVIPVMILCLRMFVFRTGNDNI